MIIGIANRGTYEAHISLEEISTENSNCWNLDFANKKISGMQMTVGLIDVSTEQLGAVGAKITRKGTSSPVAVGPGKSLDFAVKFRSANAGLYTYAPVCSSQAMIIVMCGHVQVQTSYQLPSPILGAKDI